MEDLKKLTKDELVAKIEELQKTDVGVALAERDSALAEVTKLKAARKDDETDELKRQVVELSDRLAATELTKGDDRPVVTVDGEQMLIIPRKVRIGDETLTAEQLAKRDDLLKALRKSNSHVLRSVKAIREEKERKAGKKA